jgi:DNA mismatch repair protein MutS
MSTIKDYFDYAKKYEAQYGPKTVVLMQVGGFFEVYGLKNLTTEEISGSAIVEFTQACDFAMSNKKSNGHFIDGVEYGVLMAGFPEWSSDKWFERLPTYGFTCIVIRQEKQGKKIVRDVDVILSPGTFFYESQKTLSNNIMSIKLYYRNATQRIPHPRIIVGISVVDVLTGDNFFYEYTQEYIHNPSTFDIVEKYYSIFQPNEILLIYDPDTFSKQKAKEIVSFIGASSDDVRYVENNQSINHDTTEQVRLFEKQTYQHEWIQQIFAPNEIYSFLDSTLLSENHMALENHTFLLHYVYTHNRDLVSNMKEPKILSQHDHLLLANHSLKQLNFVKDKGTKNTCVFDMVNKASTSMGSRKCTHMLMNPTTNKKKLTFEYDSLTKLNKSKSYSYDDFSKLSKMNDMTKNMRKLTLKKYEPNIISQFFEDFICARNIMQNASEEKVINNYVEHHTSSNIECIIEQNETMISFIQDNINMDKCSNTIFFGFEENIFTPEYSEDLQKLYDDYSQLHEEITAHISELNKVISDNSKSKTKVPPVKLYSTEKQHMYLKCTNAKAKTLMAHIKSAERVKDYSNITTESATSSEKKIVSPFINRILYSIKATKDRINSMSMEVLIRFISEFIEHKDKIQSIISCIESIDLLVMKENIMRTKNYCVPTIGKGKMSYFDAKDLRHALIEDIQTDIEYTPNDVSLKENGILLYGTNAVGKSSLIKSIGIAVILAQCGFPVPASTFDYVPYKELFTRILGNDDLFKGLSTFAVEMSELRTILKNSTKNSLVLGDELCSGTEYGSAISIFSAGLEHLTKEKSAFIFATHFHEINDFDFIKENERIMIKHMAVHFDNKLDCLVYDRKLRDGGGANMYGLEVCKSLKLPKDFLEKAFSIRNSYIDKDLFTTSVKSSYNSKKLKHMCELCGEKADDIHHMQYQQMADENGFIKTIHKNHKSNLMSICKECHNNIHANNKLLKRVKTTEGNKIIEA